MYFFILATVKRLSPLFFHNTHINFFLIIFINVFSVVVFFLDKLWYKYVGGQKKTNSTRSSHTVPINIQLTFTT